LSGRDDTAAYQLVNRKNFEQIDLVSLLDPDGRAQKQRPSWNSIDPGDQIDFATDAFYRYNASELVLRRNRVQERILPASNQRCNVFKSGLQRSYSRGNFWFGTVATISGVAGAVVKSVQASKYLAGAAGIFSGTRAEWNQDFLSNLAVHVIVSGIETRQQQIYTQIVQNGQNKTIEQYTVEAAIKDALFYHGQCSVVTGLEVASNSIKLAAEPGIDAATVAMLKVKNAQNIANGGTPDPALASKIQQIQSSSVLFAGTTLGNTAANSSDTLDTLKSIIGAVAINMKSIATIAASLTTLTTTATTSRAAPTQAARQASIAADSQLTSAGNSPSPDVQVANAKAHAIEKTLADGFNTVGSDLTNAERTFAPDLTKIPTDSVTQATFTKTITDLNTALTNICK
jgi:hypothetical protein